MSRNKPLQRRFWLTGYFRGCVWQCAVLSCYESARTRPRAKAVQALAAVLGVDVLQLLAARNTGHAGHVARASGLTRDDIGAALASAAASR
ncbi:hypothetical protein [Micromonospora sp. NPDC050276]|uniref:hypothetical protein n=1 Tax=Micromonospora sp. NPDC050276 TaxID=3364278 RepID=UPI00378A7EE0